MQPLRPTIPLLLLLCSACSHFVVRSGEAFYEEARDGSARVLVRHDLALISVAGTPRAMGEQVGRLLAEPMREIKDATFSGLGLGPEARARAMALEGHIPAEKRDELRAVARAADVPYEDLVLANAVVDSACSAFVASGAATRDGALLVGRNMDFWPTHVLGPSTALILFRPEGKRAFVSVGWPGVSGVISGMNRDGLVVAILINHGRGGRQSALPLAFALREVLERCGSVEEARGVLRERGLASDHFVLVADPVTGRVLSGQGSPVHPWREVAPQHDYLTCTNALLHLDLDRQSDERSAALVHLLEREHGRVDAAVAQRLLSATYLSFVNAQAMVFVPARRELRLARGSTFRPAARQEWVRVDLGAAFERGSFEGVEPEPATPEEEPFAHYRDEAYPRGALIERLAARARSLAAEIVADPARTPRERLGDLVNLDTSLQLALPGEPAAAPLREELGGAAVDQLALLAAGGGPAGVRDAARLIAERCALRAADEARRAALVAEAERQAAD